MAKKIIIYLGIISALVSLVLHKVYSGTEIDSIHAAKIVQDTVNKYFVREKNVTLSGNVSEESGLYKVNVNIGNVTQAFYLTKDGLRIIFPDGIVSIASLKESAEKEVEKAIIPRKNKPVIELYVMSLCPYALRAERKILPLIDTFRSKVDFKIKYIVNIKGETLNDIVSLHGIEEVKENVRQAAILKYQPDKFLSYLDKIEEKSCLISCGEIKLDDFWKEAAQKLGIDVARVESFAYGPEGLALLKTDSYDAQKYSVNASPTLIINGVKSNAIFKGEDELKQAICSAFTESPAVCLDDSMIQAKK